MSGSVIIAGDRHSGRSTLLNKMLFDEYLEYSNGVRTISFRREGYESDLEDEVVFTADYVDKYLLTNVVRMHPDVIAFDSGYAMDAFSNYTSLRILGSTLFFVIDAEEDTVEELKVNAVENFLKITGQKRINGFDKIMITEVTDLAAENPFVVTEFLLEKRTNFQFNQITGVYDN
jgi:hypothetical protein